MTTGDDVEVEQPAGDPGPESDLVAACFARDPVEAGLICAHLAGEHIPAHTPDVTTWQMLWQIGPAVNPRGLAVLVRRRDLGRAQEVLARVRSGPVEPGGPGGEAERAVRPLDDADSAATETPAQRDVRRGFWAAIIFMLSLIGIPVAFYSLVLLWRGRTAWNDPDPGARRRARRRIVLGLIADAAMMLLLAFLVSLILLGFFSLSPEVSRAVTPEPIEIPPRP